MADVVLLHSLQCVLHGSSSSRSFFSSLAFELVAIVINLIEYWFILCRHIIYLSKTTPTN